MKKRQTIRRGICGLCLCAGLVLLTGCSTPSASAPEKSLSETWAEESHTEITLVNASGQPVRELEVTPVETYAAANVLAGLGRDVEPDEAVSVKIPETEEYRYTLAAYGADGSLFFYDILNEYTLKSGSILVLPPDDSHTLQLVYAPGTDTETARQDVLAQYQAAHADDQTEPSSALTAGEIADAVNRLGYDTLADMRTAKHVHLGQAADNSAVPFLYRNLCGYWYPDGNRDSLTYFSIGDDMLRWYAFDPEAGDVETGCAAITGNALKQFYLVDGSSFRLEDGSIQFEGDNTRYTCSNA